MPLRSPTERYLEDFHQRLPGTTSAAFADLATEKHSCSYSALTALVPTTGAPLAVLDLACGDGYLLSQLAHRQQPGLQLVGVDMSQAELDAARSRLPGDVILLKERAQALSVATASIDILLSHMAIMLMDDVEQVLREVQRVLRRDGTFAVLIGRTFLLGAVGTAFMQAFRPIAEEDRLPTLPMGDPRTRSEAGWQALLRTHFSDISIEDIDVHWHPQPEALWGSLKDTYDIDRLTAAAKARLKERFLASVADLRQNDGTVPTGWGLRLITARRR
ncbi:class I SAM-dependent methyltransferase [Pseudomonas sp. 15FMM2]|uniref:Class I SAM-dependent methyltransferase n=1 Tax=Pseudomonas imrae TaxID=2992837 RepID=A0ACC7P7C9_9PSED